MCGNPATRLTYNVIARSATEVAHKLDVLRRHCADVGRNPGEIGTSVLYVGDALTRGDTQRFVEEARSYAALGVETVVVMPLRADPVAFLERLGSDVVARLGELQEELAA